MQCHGEAGEGQVNGMQWPGEAGQGQDKGMQGQDNCTQWPCGREQDNGMQWPGEVGTARTMACRGLVARVRMGQGHNFQPLESNRIANLSLRIESNCESHYSRIEFENCFSLREYANGLPRFGAWPSPAKLKYTTHF